jgi:hypothetical protein
MTLANIRWLLDHANMTDEEENELHPWAWNNKPMPVEKIRSKWRRGFYTRTGPEFRECEGYILVYEDGSKLRIDDRDKLAEGFCE